MPALSLLTDEARKTLRAEVITEVCKELGYTSYDAEWGREHLVGSGGDSYFNSDSLTIFRKLIGARMQLKAAGL
jgi:hypothetical protein